MQVVIVCLVCMSVMSMSVCSMRDTLDTSALGVLGANNELISSMNIIVTMSQTILMGSTEDLFCPVFI